MNLNQKIKCAFEHRLKPNAIINYQDAPDSDESDALWFSGRDWSEITCADWENHSGALYAFTSEAFAYYLPSILSLSSSQPKKWLWPTDTLLRILDRSPVIEYWDSFITTRLIGLEAAEYEVLKDWLLSLSGHINGDAEDALCRGLETVELLQKETQRVRVLMGVDSTR
jgi:hypothetical protein